MPTGKGPLRIVIEDFLTTFGFGNRVTGWLKYQLELWEQETLDAWQGWIDHFGIGSVIPDELKPGALKSRVSHQVELLIALVPILISVVWEVVTTLTEPIRVYVRRKFARLVPTGRPSVSEMVEMYARFPELKGKVTDWLLEEGLPGDVVGMLYSLNQHTVGVSEYLALYQRGEIDFHDFTTSLSRLGYDSNQAALIQKLGQKIPGVGDITSMAVRDAWNDEAANRFGYDEGLPAEFGSYLQKQGLSADWAKRFWRAHWQLPGIGNAFEMFQRLRPNRTSAPFSQDDLADYLKTADIPPFFRQRLLEIAYSPLTRVDIARMYKVGVLTAAEVYEQYRDIGYNEKNARLMTDFTTRDEKSGQQDLSRGAIQDAYKKGYWGRQQAHDALVSIGITAEDAEFWLGLVDIDIDNQIRDANLAAIQVQYENGQLDDVTVYNAINKLNLPSERVTAILTLWNARKQARVNIPSRSELDDFMRREIIDETAYRAYLAKDGYQPKEIELFVKRIDQLVTEDKNAELATQQTEQERLANANKATDYQRTVAGLNVQIAQNNSAIADIKLALHDETDPDVIDAGRSQIDYLKSQNAVLNVKKAEARQLLIGQ